MTLFDPIHMMSMANTIAISIEIVRIDSECSLEKDFIELIHVNLQIVIIRNCQSCY